MSDAREYAAGVGSATDGLSFKHRTSTLIEAELTKYLGLSYPSALHDSCDQYSGNFFA